VRPRRLSKSSNGYTRVTWAPIPTRIQYDFILYYFISGSVVNFLLYEIEGRSASKKVHFTVTFPSLALGEMFTREDEG